MELSQYFAKIKTAVSQNDGETLAELLSYSNYPSLNIRIPTMSRKPSAISKIARKWLPDAWAEIVADFIISQIKLDIFECYEWFAKAMKRFNIIFKTHTNWSLPVLFTFCSTLLKLATESDKEKIAYKQKPEKLEHARELLLQSFKITTNDRKSLDISKKFGAIAVVNSLFFVYFKINNLRMCKNLIRSIETPQFPSLDKFSISQTVTYKYFLGRLALLNSEYKKAEEHLTYAFNNCTKYHKKNKAMILLYLLPIQFLKGKVPSKKLLIKYPIPQFKGIVESYISGNVNEFSNCIIKNQKFFIQKGIFLILENAKFIVYRNLFYRTYKISNINKINFSIFQKAFDIIGVSISLDEIECILSILISQKKIIGYISHKLSTLVLKKDGAFPKLNLITKN
ncbi:pci domain-containing protein [Anaeramoeba flamelloides]|uniref:Pci domain-containing protein n=1 Tax=Anaeramoeba flamelloides TaxID=1746091 RepID=A0AAV7ZFF5_9EUKA|nr:pci domain-containing protein [Anaeramoeba flamelloides]